MKLGSTWIQGTYHPLKHAGQFSNMICKTNLIKSTECLSTMKTISTYISLPMLKFRMLNGPGSDIARRLLYHEVPIHFVWVKMGDKYAVLSPCLQEISIVIIFACYCAIDEDQVFFEDLKTVDGVVMEIYKTAALSLGFLESDEESHRCLLEASAFQMPRQLRHLFAVWFTVNLLVRENYGRRIRNRIAKTSSEMK
ncbi:Helitron helicase [Phytophthora megakarya]|uniref:Helitron helicase n=1 Tax=Phytophthora megakarya TaxID=4795 RepID=A0A225W4C1_9STRA|nr:Helitron helicase [Phytophthora megakarya]